MSLARWPMKILLVGGPKHGQHVEVQSPLLPRYMFPDEIQLSDLFKSTVNPVGVELIGARIYDCWSTSTDGTPIYRYQESQRERDLRDRRNRQRKQKGTEA